MAIQLISTWSELASLESQWNAIAEGMPFGSWDWLATWWKHYGVGAAQSSANGQPHSGQRQLYVLAVCGKGEVDGKAAGAKDRLIGIAPWYLDRTIVHGNVLRWLGSGEVCTDHLSLICRPENRQEVAAAVAHELTANRDDWDRIDLSAVDANDPAITELVTAFEEHDCLISRHAADSCWVLELPASWDDYLASISKSHRKQLRKLERRVLDSKRACWHQVTSASELPAAWEILVDLHQRRRQSLGEPGCFASRPFHDFHREVAERLLARRQLRMSWLELDGAPAAAEYHLADASATYAYQGGVDPIRLSEEPGRLSTILCLRAAIAEGHSRFDFLRGDEPYKAHWRAAPQPTVDYRIIPNRRLARLRGRVLNVTGAITDWVRQTTEQSPT
ncbi:MAG TPA: GNAT family N-acetyltransferase [Lacipirellulaceae bacterium]